MPTTPSARTPLVTPRPGHTLVLLAPGPVAEVANQHFTHQAQDTGYEPAALDALATALEEAYGATAAAPAHELRRLADRARRNDGSRCNEPDEPIHMNCTAAVCWSSCSGSKAPATTTRRSTSPSMSTAASATHGFWPPAA